jgi:hypothetical protein
MRIKDVTIEEFILSGNKDPQPFPTWSNVGELARLESIVRERYNTHRSIFQRAVRAVNDGRLSIAFPVNVECRQCRMSSKVWSLQELEKVIASHHGHWAWAIVDGGRFRIETASKEERQQGISRPATTDPYGLFVAQYLPRGLEDVFVLDHTAELADDTIVVPDPGGEQPVTEPSAAEKALFERS